MRTLFVRKVPTSPRYRVVLFASSAFCPALLPVSRLKPKYGCEGPHVPANSSRSRDVHPQTSYLHISSPLASSYRSLLYILVYLWDPGLSTPHPPSRTNIDFESITFNRETFTVCFSAFLNLCWPAKVAPKFRSNESRMLYRRQWLGEHLLKRGNLVIALYFLNIFISAKGYTFRINDSVVYETIKSFSYYPEQYFPASSSIFGELDWFHQNFVKKNSLKV